MTVVANPRQYKVPDWFLNRQKDIKDGRFLQVSEKNDDLAAPEAAAAAAEARQIARRNARPSGFRGRASSDRPFSAAKTTSSYAPRARASRPAVTMVGLVPLVLFAPPAACSPVAPLFVLFPKPKIKTAHVERPRHQAARRPRAPQEDPQPPRSPPLLGPARQGPAHQDDGPPRQDRRRRQEEVSASFWFFFGG